MKKKRVFVIVGVIFIAFFLCFIFIRNRKKGIEYLDGQWKVTELAAIDRTGIIYWSEEEYLGRSISVNAGEIERSMHYWPYYLGHNTEKYEYWTIQRTLVYNWAGKAGIGNTTGWYDLYRDEIVDVVSFYLHKGDADPMEVYIIFADGSVQTQYVDGWYKIERFTEAEIDLQAKELWGAWCVERFVSYRDDWIGNRKQFEKCRGQIELFAPELKGWENAEGIDFYPKDYYEYTLLLEEEQVSLMSGEEIVEEHEVQQYEENQVDKIIYEKEKGINDELGITNEKIEVITATFNDKDGGNILDNEIVVVNENKIIMKIHNGWFLLIKNF